MTILVGFEPEREFGGGVFVRAVPHVGEAWLIPERAVEDYWIVRGRRTRLLGNTTGLGETGRGEDLPRLEAQELWLREWTWVHVLEPLLLATPPDTQLLFDTTTLGVLPLRETLWSRWRAHEVDDERLLGWQPHQLYGARFAEAIFAYLDEPDPGYHTIRILISVPTRLAAAPDELRVCVRLLHRLAALAHDRRVELTYEIEVAEFAQALDDDEPGRLTLVVAHQSASGAIEFRDGHLCVSELGGWLETRARGDWGLFVCHGEAPFNLAQLLQDHGSPLIWTAGEYAYLRETLALLIAWLTTTDDPLAQRFCNSLTGARLALARGVHVTL